MFNRFLGDAQTAASETWDFALNLASRASPYWYFIGDLLSNPWARAVGLVVIVYATIRVIASVYSGDKQNSDIGPVALRPHTGNRLDRTSIMLPHSLLSMTMDGVSADCRVFYVYRDAQGKRRRKQVYHQKNMRLAISPSRLRPVGSAQFGYEIPDVLTRDVCFPPIDVEQAQGVTPATPDRAQEYAQLHKIIENWTEDDDAPLISFEENVLEEVVDNRRDLIVQSAATVAKAREGNALVRWLRSNVAKSRTNVVGSYYIKLEFSHEPWFVLTKHPDRELKMTAWLTVLTSMFALVMDAWPKAPSASVDGAPAAIERTVPRIPRLPN